MKNCSLIWRHQPTKQNLLPLFYAALTLLTACKEHSTNIIGHGQLETTYVVAEAPGKLNKLLVQPGQHVTPKQILFSQESQPLLWQQQALSQQYQSAKAMVQNSLTGKRANYIQYLSSKLKAAEAKQQLAEKQWQRLEKLYQNQATSAAQFDLNLKQRHQAQDEVVAKKQQLRIAELAARKHQQQQLQQQAKAIYAQLQQTQWQLQQRQVRARIAGTVGQIYQTTGSMLKPTQPVLSLVQPTTHTLVAYAAPQQIAQLKLGQKLYFCSLPCQVWHHARLQKIAKHNRFTPDAFFDPSNYNQLRFKLTLHVEQQPTSPIRPGQQVTIALDR